MRGIKCIPMTIFILWGQFKFLLLPINYMGMSLMSEDEICLFPILISTVVIALYGTEQGCHPHASTVLKRRDVFSESASHNGGTVSEKSCFQLHLVPAFPEQPPRSSHLAVRRGSSSLAVYTWASPGLDRKENRWLPLLAAWLNKQWPVKG